ncbi:hypothetical protein NPX13_g2806 [Xylaria arbuscula]|uniref:Ribosome assembly protein 3 n=1 Tax=Xylaria arbuscula TaxID=114810 RepID=A0A9W8NIH4_9PEZI|nr:hypothetical protein NPX13_g2806 [Xylaria arbuscula]
MAPKPQKTEADFTAYYLHQSTKEFAEDLDKIRTADDFKSRDALSMLIRSLQQGTSMFSAADQKRIAEAAAARQNKDDDQQSATANSDDGSEKETA